MKPDQFIDALRICFKTYGKLLDPEVGRFWLAALSHGGISLSEAAAALSKHALDPDTGQYLPKVADVVKQCQGTSDDAAELAWGKAVKAATGPGINCGVVFDDPRLMNAIEIWGGWVKFCTRNLDDETADRAAFRKAYKAAPTAIRRTFLPGSYSNQSDDPPAMIGDPEKCAAILESGKSRPAIEVSISPSPMSELLAGVKKELAA